MHKLPPDLPRASIVVVEDTRASLRLLVEILSEQDYQVRPALNARDALTDIQSDPPDLILLDIMMPEMDGFAACAALKADERTRDIPVIFISALQETFDKMKAFSVGGVDYITKPFNIEEVLARVATHLSLRRMQQQLQEQNNQLQQEITERSRAESELRRVNTHLARLVAELERYNRDQAILNRMSSFLQRSESRDEAIQVSLPFLRELFMDQAGALYLYNPDSASYECVSTWGEGVPGKPALILEAGQVSARMRFHLIETIPHIPTGNCLDASDTLPAVSVQLMDRGEVLGVLQMQNGPGHSEKDYNHWTWLATMVADLLALALSNLQLRERLHDQAIRDPLTGLFNRRFLEEALSRELSHAIRHQRSMGIMMLDIDHFKRVNDTYGHDGGDAVLRTLGEFLRGQIRNSDFACRFGGEELVLIFPDATLEATLQRAEAFRTSIQELQIEHRGQMLDAITVSIGVSSFPEHGTSLEVIIAAADAALYQAKASGRNRVCLATAAEEE